MRYYAILALNFFPTRLFVQIMFIYVNPTGFPSRQFSKKCKFAPVVSFDLVRKIQHALIT